MGVLNLTSDSFFADSRAAGSEECLRKVEEMLEAGADIIDLGACSTRPDSEPVSPEEELSRLEMPLTAIRSAFPEAIISVDTFRPEVAERCLKEWKVDIINDISCGSDPDMMKVVSRYGAAYVLMHNRGYAAKSDCREDYDDVVADTVRELAFKVNEARREGIANLIVDPGFGFAKDERQNFELLKRLDWFGVLGCPLLVGVSRKRMAREGYPPDSREALIGTAVLDAVALSKNAAVIRVHDVAEGDLTRRLMEKLWISE